MATFDVDDAEPEWRHAGRHVGNRRDAEGDHGLQPAGGTVNAKLGDTGCSRRVRTRPHVNNTRGGDDGQRDRGPSKLGAPIWLADGATVAISGGRKLDMATFDDQVTTLNLNGGTLDGTSGKRQDAEGDHGLANRRAGR